MSRTKSVSLVTKKHTSPFVPAGTMAATALIRPSPELRVDTTGCGPPHGNVVKNPSGPCGTTVTLREYACAVAGMLQVLLGMVKPRTDCPLKNGPPRAPFGFLVSTTRHGVTGTKLRPAVTFSVAEPAVPFPPSIELTRLVVLR